MKSENRGFKWSELKIRRFLVVFFFSLLFFIIPFGLIMAHELKYIDFPSHIVWSKEYGDIGYIKRPNVLYEQLVVVIRSLLPANILVRISQLAKQVYDLKSYEISTWVLMMISHGATVYILVKRIIKEWSKGISRTPLFMVLVAVFAILLVSPIFIFTMPNRLYMGYFNPNVYHNPTYILLRPFALLAFFNITDNLFSKWNWKESVIVAISIICATQAKPSFTITVLPAIGLMILVFYLNKFKNLNFYYLIIPIGLISIIMLGSQYFINYFGDGGERILVSPFKTLLIYVPSIPSILIFGMLSILFPLLVSIFHWNENSKNVSFRLVWLNFLVAVVFDYFLYEQEEIVSNNFAWGVMIAVLLLFIEAVIIFGREILNKGFTASLKSWKTLVPGGFLMLHVGCGIYYFIRCLTPINTFIM